MDNMRMLHLHLGDWMSGFELEKAVCNHGFFMMPPNQWIPSSKTLQRPLRLADSSTSVPVSISQTSSHLLTIQLHSSRSLSPQDHQALLDQVIRMLRITQKDEDKVREFHKLHPRAKQMGFGRLFRSPTLFEDAVKSILLCNTSWRRTLAMAGQLCELQAKLAGRSKKRKRKGGRGGGGGGGEEGGNFPNAREVCRMSVAVLRKGLVGYRAAYIVNLAESVESGRMNLQKLEEAAAMEGGVWFFPKVKGFGPFASANILMCVGVYDKVPIDTETVRHLREVHGRQVWKKHKGVEEEVKQIYDEYAPFQCLAYWLELVEYYEAKFGKLSELSRHDYDRISGTTIITI